MFEMRDRHSPVMKTAFLTVASLLPLLFFPTLFLGSEDFPPLLCMVEERAEGKVIRKAPLPPWRTLGWSSSSDMSTPRPAVPFVSSSSVRYPPGRSCSGCESVFVCHTLSLVERRGFAHTSFPRYCSFLLYYFPPPPSTRVFLSILPQTLFADGDSSATRRK